MNVTAFVIALAVSLGYYFYASRKQRTPQAMKKKENK